MENPDTIRVVIPAFNAAPFLAETVMSALAARDVAVRVVIVDDGSQDDTAAVARYLQAEHDNVRLIMQPNGGVAAARNAGIDIADRYVCFLDADDLLVPDGLAHLLRGLQSDANAVAAYGRVGHLRQNGKHTAPLPSRARQSGDVGATVLQGNLVDTPGAVLFRSAAVARTGGFVPGVRIGEDWNLYARVAQLGRILFVDETVLWYRLHEGSVMSRGRRTLADFRSALDATYNNALIRSKHSDDVLAKSRVQREIGLTAYIIQRARSVSDIAGSMADLVSSDGFVRHGGLMHKRFLRLIGTSIKACLRLAL